MELIKKEEKYMRKEEIIDAIAIINKCLSKELRISWWDYRGINNNQIRIDVEDDRYHFVLPFEFAGIYNEKQLLKYFALRCNSLGSSEISQIAYIDGLYLTANPEDREYSLSELVDKVLEYDFDFILKPLKKTGQNLLKYLGIYPVDREFMTEEYFDNPIKSMQSALNNSHVTSKKTVNDGTYFIKDNMNYLKPRMICLPKDTLSNLLYCLDHKPYVVNHKLHITQDACDWMSYEQYERYLKYVQVVKNGEDIR